MLLERRFILQQVEPLAVHPVRQSGPLARERPDLPLEPREGPLALDSELMRERLKLPEQVVQPHRGQESGPVRLFEHRPLEAIVCGDCLPVRQPGTNFGEIMAFYMASYHSNRKLIPWGTSRVDDAAPHNSGCCFRVGTSPSTQGAGRA